MQHLDGPCAYVQERRYCQLKGAFLQPNVFLVQANMTSHSAVQTTNLGTHIINNNYHCYAPGPTHSLDKTNSRLFRIRLDGDE
jgi:hypothetical protein